MIQRDITFNFHDLYYDLFLRMRSFFKKIYFNSEILNQINHKIVIYLKRSKMNFMALSFQTGKLIPLRLFNLFFNRFLSSQLNLIGKLISVFKKHIYFFLFFSKHKWYVMKACFSYKLYWRGIVHDLDKLLPDEWFAYVKLTDEKGKVLRDSTGYYVPTAQEDYFVKAWFLHQKRNKHHWQWWILPTENKEIKVLSMPTKMILEMMCDWYGASCVNNKNGTGGWSNVKKWWFVNKNRMVFHPDTFTQIEKNFEKILS